MRRVHWGALLVSAVTLGCAGPDPAGESLSRAALGMDVCVESVPADRNVDGIPAYAQCDGTTKANIWSNNGLDTSTTSLGDDWIQTQRGGGYQCTELAYRYMHFRWHVDYRHGDAREWCDGDLPSTLVKSASPNHGDLIVFDGGVCGADETTGHIAVVDVVDASGGKVTIVEENRAGRRSTNASCATCFLHAVANDGSSSTAGTGAGGSSGNGPAGGAGGTPAGPGGAGRGGNPMGGGAAGATPGGRPGGAGRGPLGGTGGVQASAQAGHGGATASDGGVAGAPATGGAASGGTFGAAAGAPMPAAAGQTQAAAGNAATGNAGASATTPEPVSEPAAENGCGIARRGAPGPFAVFAAFFVGLGAVCRRRRSAPARRVSRYAPPARREPDAIRELARALGARPHRLSSHDRKSAARAAS